MILLTMSGPFHLSKNQKLHAKLSTLTCMFALNSHAPFSPSNPIMVASLTTPHYVLSTPLMASLFVFLARVPHLKMEKAEHILRTLNDGVHALLFHASMPSYFWAEALQTSTFLLNLRPCKPKALAMPYQLLVNRTPDNNALRVFGCLSIPTYHPLAHTNSHHALWLAFFLTTRRIIKATCVTTWPHGV